MVPDNHDLKERKLILTMEMQRHPDLNPSEHHPNDYVFEGFRKYKKSETWILGS